MSYTMSIERMTRFLNDVQGTFMQYGWPYTLPRVTQNLDENEDPLGSIDAHWKEPKFELLLTLDDGSFVFYGDDYGKREFKKSDASPQDVAEALHLLANTGATS